MKGNKLPKKAWVKGKSKFAIPRMIQEGILTPAMGLGYAWWNGAARDSLISQLYKKLNLI